MSDDSKVYIHPAEVKRRLDRVENELEETGGKLDDILLCAQSVKHDIKTLSDKLGDASKARKDLQETVEQNTEWRHSNKHIVSIMALIITAATVAALLGVDVSAVL